MEPCVDCSLNVSFLLPYVKMPTRASLTSLNFPSTSLNCALSAVTSDDVTRADPSALSGRELMFICFCKALLRDRVMMGLL